MGALQNLQGATKNLADALPAIVDAINRSKTGIAEKDVQDQVDSLNISIGTINNALAQPVASPAVVVPPAA